MALCLWMRGGAYADSFTGADWIVHFNLPDQNSSVVAPGEYAIRDALLARINSLQTNDLGLLATYTFSATSLLQGVAGPVVIAVSNALARGASVGFVVDAQEDATNEYWPGISLRALSLRPGNKLRLAVNPATNSANIMHDKLGVFHYASGESWVFSGSWNFTGGACIQQWNIMTEIRNDALFRAYTNEFREFFAGRFNTNSLKSHAHDYTRFSLRDASGAPWVRFAPYPDGRIGGTNAQTDIVRAISNAQSEIFFALNKLTRPLVRDALIDAANRGVQVYGVIPKSDWNTPSKTSYDTYWYLVTNTAAYTTTNRVHMLTPFSKADGSAYDNGETDLVHTKYLVLDPWGAAPMVIHGSANWTAAALVYTNSNDENVLFLPHPDLARTFYLHFKRMTGFRAATPEFWCGLHMSRPFYEVRFFRPDDWDYALEMAESLSGEWIPLLATGGEPGTVAAQVRQFPVTAFFRVIRQ